MQKIQEPFLHFVIPNFLSPKEYAQTLNAYSRLNFIEKTSDLFHFFQTNQLANDDSVATFRNAIRRQFGKMSSLKNSSFNIFASYYFKGDYLLCHDDVIDDRKYAFSYYLEDHPSAELVFYDATATKEVKRIQVKKNLLAIFEVSNISYHEVAESLENGRKAITGWLNIKGQGALRPVKKIAEFKPSVPRTIQQVEFPDEVGSQEHMVLEDVDYDFTKTAEVTQGLLFQRKVNRLTLQSHKVPTIKDNKLISADFYHFRKGDYILLNDPVNSLKDVLDVFVVKLCGKKPKSSNSSLIDIVGKEGTQGVITASHNNVFVVQRGEKQYYFRKAEKQFWLAHFIYRREEKVKKKSLAKNAIIKQARKGMQRRVGGKNRPIRKLKRISVPKNTKKAGKTQRVLKKGKRVAKRQ